MDQIDLFNIEHIEHNLSTEVVISETKPSLTPKPLKPQKLTTYSSVTNILAFASKYQRDMWHTFKHRRDCMMHLTGFASFKDFGMKPMNQVTALDCIDYPGYLVSTGMKTGTVNRHMSAVSACFRFAVEELQIMTDRPRVALLKEEEPNTRAFTKGQVRKLIDHFNANGDEWMGLMVKLGCLTGMRQSEITSLPLPCIEWFDDRNEIWLPPEITKTKKGRMVSLAAEGAWKTAIAHRDCIVREFTHRRFYDRWNDTKYELGHIKDDWFKFHATRHFAATNMASAGKNALTVAGQLGHSSIATTNKYYHGDATARANATAAFTI